ncbi:MAG: choice-of-anchor Q domain-containing protein, partial [Candidatus Acidoferrales bacterium]
VPIERPIVANTATTISVFTDVAFLGVPGFAYEVNDYRLTAASPCIDAADNTAVPEGITTDLDGNPRFLEIPETPDTGNPPGGGPIVDMGAYESLGGGTGTAMAPILAVPKKQAMKSAESGSTSSTRSPACTPSSPQAVATRAARSASSS